MIKPLCIPEACRRHWSFPFSSSRLCCSRLSSYVMAQDRYEGSRPIVQYQLLDSDPFEQKYQRSNEFQYCSEDHADPMSLFAGRLWTRAARFVISRDTSKGRNARRLRIYADEFLSLLSELPHNVIECLVNVDIVLS